MYELINKAKLWNDSLKEQRHVKLKLSIIWGITSKQSTEYQMITYNVTRDFFYKAINKEMQRQYQDVTATSNEVLWKDARS